MSTAKQMTAQLVENVKAALTELKDLKKKTDYPVTLLLIDLKIAEFEAKLEVLETMQRKFNGDIH